MTIRLEGLTPLIQVFDMPRALAFYRSALGFELVAQSQPGEEHFGWGLLRRDGVELMLNTAYEPQDRPARADPARTAAHADTMLFFACRDLDAAFAHLCEHGIEAAAPVVTAYGMRQIWLADPDGYAICLQWPSP